MTILGRLGRKAVKVGRSRLSPLDAAERAAEHRVKALRSMGGRHGRTTVNRPVSHSIRHTEGYIQKSAGQAHQRAHNRRTGYNMAMLGGAYGLSLKASNRSERTRANQSTFARRNLLGQKTVGISSGALQGFNDVGRSLGGL